MGSNMKSTIFNERVATALKNWHHTAKKHIKQNKGSVTVTPFSSRPNTPSHHTSPVHLLKNYRPSEMADSVHTSPRRSVEQWDTDSPSPSHTNYGDGSSSHHRNNMVEKVEDDRDDNMVVDSNSSDEQRVPTQHEIYIGPKEFSFDRRTSI